MAGASTIMNVLAINDGVNPFGTALAGGADAQATANELQSSANSLVPATTNVAYRLPVAGFGVPITVYNNAASALAGKVYPPLGGTIYASGAAGVLNAGVSVAQFVAMTFVSLGNGSYIAK